MAHLLRPWELIEATAHDEDAGTGFGPFYPSWVDMSDYQGFGILVVSTRLNAGIPTISIVGSTSSAGTSPEVIKTFDGTNPTTVFEWAAMDITWDDIATVNPNLRYVSASVTYDDALIGESLTFYALIQPRYFAGTLTTTGTA